MAYSPQTFEQLFLNFIAYLVSKNSKITNFKPGSRIRTLAEGFFLELSKIGYEFFAGYKESIRESCYESFEFDKLPAEKAAGFLRIESSSHTSDIIIPKFQISLAGLVYETLADTILPVGQIFVDADIMATTAGSSHNLDALSIDSNEGQGNILLDDEFTYDRVYNPTAIIGGNDGETDSERAERFMDYVKSFYRSTLSGIRYAVRTTPGVKDYYVFDNVDPVTNQESPGWINILLSDGTNTVSESVIQAVRDRINGIEGDSDYPGYRAGGTRLSVSKLNIVPVNIFYEIEIDENSDSTDAMVISAVNTAIMNYVNGLKNGQDVLIDTVKAVGLTATNNIYRIKILNFYNDIQVNAGVVPKIGGSGGGTILCNKIERVIAK